MFAGLAILVPLLMLVAFTIWAAYRCRMQTAAFLTRPPHAATKVEECCQEPQRLAGPPGPPFLDSHFQHNHTSLSGRADGWGLVRHLSQGARHYPCH